MSEYKRNKLRTARDIVAKIENWPDAFGLRIFQKRPGLHLLRFRDGMNIVVRGGNREWDVVHELFFAKSYHQCLEWLKTRSNPKVIDLGGNIGLFSLLTARAHATATIDSFEPGPPNARLFEVNMLLNDQQGARVRLQRAAVGGVTERATWCFDEANPGGSSLFGTGTHTFEVDILGFADLIARYPDGVDLVKIDIEGAEYGILEQTPRATWDRIKAIALELHDDPAGKVSREVFLERMKSFGFAIEQELVCSYFLHRA